MSLPTSSTNTTIGFVDSDWAGDIKHQKSISGICLYFAGAPVVYHSRFQSTISQSSTEAEFITANRAGKLALYLRSMLNDLGIPQDSATSLYENNCTAIDMANAHCPTRRTHHMDVKHFALLTGYQPINLSYPPSPYMITQQMEWPNHWDPTYLHSTPAPCLVNVNPPIAHSETIIDVLIYTHSCSHCMILNLHI